nr:hypothetical protein [Tanacetum cinerariifolium]
MTKVIKGEFEKLEDLKVDDVSLTCETLLGVFNNEFNRMSGKDDDSEQQVSHEADDDMGYDPSDVVLENIKSDLEKDEDEQGKKKRNKGVITFFEVGANKDSNPNGVFNDVGGVRYSKADGIWVPSRRIEDGCGEVLGIGEDDDLCNVNTDGVMIQSKAGTYQSSIHSLVMAARVLSKCVERSVQRKCLSTKRLIKKSNTMFIPYMFLFHS